MFVFLCLSLSVHVLQVLFADASLQRSSTNPTDVADAMLCIFGLLCSHPQLEQFSRPRDFAGGACPLSFLLLAPWARLTTETGSLFRTNTGPLLVREFSACQALLTFAARLRRIRARIRHFSIRCRAALQAFSTLIFRAPPHVLRKMLVFG